MISVGAKRGKTKAYGLVRDKDGRPVIDNIHGIPKGFWDLLTEAEKADIKKQGGYPET